MNASLYRAAQAMAANQRSLDVIAANLANIDTVGFKRRAGAVRQFRIPERGDARGMESRESVDFTQGNLKRTDREYDLALVGEGFFVIDGERGELYTRDGAMSVTPGGVLVTRDGLPVAWASRGAPIDPVGLPITVDGEGTVRQNGQELGRLRIANFEDAQRLRSDGNGNWIAPPGLAEATATAEVHQFALEESNATGIQEMIAMIQVQRSFEMAARVMSTIQDSYQRLTRPFQA